MTRHVSIIKGGDPTVELSCEDQFRKLFSLGLVGGDPQLVGSRIPFGFLEILLSRSIIISVS